LESIYEFTPFPYGDLFQESKKLSQEIDKQPLVLSRCKKCLLLQLKNVTNLAKQYEEYLYFTKTTKFLSDFYKEVSDRLIGKLQLKLNDLVIDIGSNDGTFLNFFKNANIKVLGVDPSRPACLEAKRKNIEIINGFFNESIAATIKSTEGCPKLITCNYTIANLDNLASFFKALKILCDEDTHVNVITGYHLDQFSIHMFDYAGHDHLTYLTLHDFCQLAQRFGLKVIAARRHEHKGGSLEVEMVSESSRFQADYSVHQLLQRENWQRSSNNSQILNMVNLIKNNKDTINSIIGALVNSGNRIIGVGASISTTHLIYEFDIYKHLDFLVDDDTRKIGKYSPGVGLEVYPLEVIKENSNSVAIILAWQHTKLLLKRLEQINFKGLVIVPMPYVEVKNL
jgi:SAM-dependent methyltransferase